MTGKKKILSPYYVVTVIILVFLAVFFLFPLYWIVTGSVKEKSDVIIKSDEMVKWIPTTVSWDNFARLFRNKTELSGIGTPTTIRWPFNSVFISATAMIFTCTIVSPADHALAKKCFQGKRLIFSLFVCAMALPKQVIFIPLTKEMLDLGLTHSVWGSTFAVICPMVGWPLGVFMMKQFFENIPVSLLEVIHTGGAGELTTFINVASPTIRPGFGALAISTFINSWNEYPPQLVMLTQNEPKTIALGIASKLSEISNNLGLIMAGTAPASVPVIIVFLCFQKYFT